MSANNFDRLSNADVELLASELFDGIGGGGGGGGRFIGGGGGGLAASIFNQLVFFCLLFDHFYSIQRIYLLNCRLLSFFNILSTILNKSAATPSNTILSTR